MIGKILAHIFSLVQLSQTSDILHASLQIHISPFTTHSIYMLCKFMKQMLLCWQSCPEIHSFCLHISNTVLKSIIHTLTSPNQQLLRGCLFKLTCAMFISEPSLNGLTVPLHIPRTNKNWVHAVLVSLYINWQNNDHLNLGCYCSPLGDPGDDIKLCTQLYI